uniref:Uncharacterized protein n=1 Tax=Oryza sativa subsp. japonica TaxID=39947 RepID=Q8GVR4_ORYSJ|nr:hypothetical protein [Oryza sativa Japonica Group]
MDKMDPHVRCNRRKPTFNYHNRLRNPPVSDLPRLEACWAGPGGVGSGWPSTWMSRITPQ